MYGLTVSNQQHLFRSLTGKEEEAVTVLDNRDIFWGQDLDGKLFPNNDVLIIGDHASNDIKFYNFLLPF